MERSQREKLTEELTLVLLYLTSFTEKQCPNVRMAWKTHDWTALDDLAEDGFMVPPHNRKNYTRYLTDGQRATGANWSFTWFQKRRLGRLTFFLAQTQDRLPLRWRPKWPPHFMNKSLED